MGVSFPLITTAGLANGLNPCALGMMITFLGYLIVFGDYGKKKKEENNRGFLAIGGVYLLGVLISYLILGLAFYQLAYVLQRSWLGRNFNLLIGGAMILIGLVQFKEVFWSDLPIHLTMPKKAGIWLGNLMKKSGLPTAFMLGALTTALGTPCILPMYVGTATVLARSGLSLFKIVGYFLYYNLLFILPLVVVLGVMYKGRGVIEMKEWGHRSEKWMRGLAGTFLIGLGIWLLR